MLLREDWNEEEDSLGLTMPLIEKLLKDCPLYVRGHPHQGARIGFLSGLGTLRVHCRGTLLREYWNIEGEPWAKGTKGDAGNPILNT